MTTEKQAQIIEWADEISDVALDACGGDQAEALRLICKGLDERLGEEIAEELLAYWCSVKHAVMAAAHKAAVRRYNKEQVK